MIPEVRTSFNENFTEEKYDAFITELGSKHPGSLEFRVSETPVFVPKHFTEKMLRACESIVDVICAPGFKKLTEGAIPQNERVPNENDYCDFIAFDFGICQNEQGELEPQLIEMQGFPSLFAYQVFNEEILRKHFYIPENYTPYLNGYTRETYLKLLKDIIVGDHSPEEVILLELKPHEQKTRIDFYCTADYLHIPIVCLTELDHEGDKLYYTKNGMRVRIKRIYNRIIFDELSQVKDSLGDVTDITQPYDVEWVPHPNWFYRISKFTLPFIVNEYVPETFFLNEVHQLPDSLDNFVLKPLFSFAGQGVIIDVTKEDIEKIKDPENWILQRKVNYADVIETPEGPAKAEIRIFYFWKKGDKRPVGVNNLARMSKGKMIGVRYNKDKKWVGGSTAFFEQ